MVLAAGQNMVRAAMPQVLQFPFQQTIPVQIPMQTGNGQTIIQTVHIPVQTLATSLPNSGVLQGGQFQVIQPQLTQVSSPKVPFMSSIYELCQFNYLSSFLNNNLPKS